MASVTGAILTDLVNQLVGANLSLPFSVSGHFYREISREDFPDLTLVVIPTARIPTEFTRGQDLKTFGFAIFVLKTVPGVAQADLDPLVEFVESLEDFLNDPSNKVLATTRARRTSTRATPDPIVDTDELKDHAAFVAMVAVEYDLEADR